MRARAPRRLGAFNRQYRGGGLPKTAENMIDSTLLTSTDVSASERTSAAIVEALEESLVVLDSRFRVLSANPAFYRTFRCFSSQTKHELFFELGSGAWDIPRLRGLLQAAISGGTQVTNLELDHVFPSVGHKTVLLHTHQLDRRRTGAKMILLSIEDITERRRVEQELRKSEDASDHIIEAVPGGVVQVAADGSIVRVNTEAGRILGLPRDEFTERRLDDWEGHTIHEDGTPCPVEDYPATRCLQSGRPQPFSTIGVQRPDGGIVWVLVWAAPLLGPEGRLEGGIINFLDITEQKRAVEALHTSERALRESQAELRTLTAGLLTAQEEERKRISRELHDDFNQRLAMLAHEAESFQKQLPRSVKGLRESLRVLQKHAAELSDDARRIAHQLHPSAVEHLGLVPALRSYCAEFSQQERVRAEFAQRRVPASLPPDIALCLYRLTQEGLRNVAKHSGTDQARVVLSGKKNEIHLSIVDSGVGFNPRSGKRNVGLGLVSIQERTRLLGGSVSITSKLGEGTRLDIRIPLPERNG